MPEFRNLPKVEIERVDGNLKVSTTDSNPRVLLLGTASEGPGDDPFNARDLARARQVFGQASELYQGLVECKRGYGEAANIWLYRIGTEPAMLQIGDEETSPEVVKIVVRDRSTDIGSTYKASYNATDDVLWVYNEEGTLIWSNSPLNMVDLGEIEVRGTLSDVTNASSFGDPTNGLITGSVTFSTSTASGTTFTAASAGPAATNLKARYEALQDAYRLLENEDFDLVVPLGVRVDDPNVAVFVSGIDTWNDRDNPAVWGSGTLGWFKETAPASSSSTGRYTYQWANDVGLSGVVGSGVAENAWPTPAARIAADFHEVSFSYQLANFCYQQTKNQSTCIGVIGVRPPVAYSLGEVHSWIGDEPTVDQNGTITADGFGLLGHMDIGGVRANKLNPLAHDKATGRSPGYFATASEFRDDTALLDDGNQPIDIGAYISITAAWPRHLISVSSITGYSNDVASYYAGMIGRLDEKDAPTNTLAPGLRVPYNLGKRRTDNIVKGRLVTLEQRPEGAYVVDAPTFARENSDFRRLTTVRLVSLAEDRIRAIGWQFIGKASNAITKAAFESAIEEELQKLTKRGYLKRYQVAITTNTLQDILGQVHIRLLLVVPNELRQVFATIALGVQ